jgi:hypothetical protein
MTRWTGKAAILAAGAGLAAATGGRGVQAWLAPRAQHGPDDPEIGTARLWHHFH